MEKRIAGYVEVVRGLKTSLEDQYEGGFNPSQTCNCSCNCYVNVHANLTLFLTVIFRHIAISNILLHYIVLPVATWLIINGRIYGEELWSLIINYRLMSNKLHFLYTSMYIYILEIWNIIIDKVITIRSLPSMLCSFPTKCYIVKN